ncbi:MAG: hypothetical protein ABJF05_22190 [Paracoccaceae bacterium]
MHEKNSMKLILRYALVLSLTAHTALAQNTNLFNIDNQELARLFLEEAVDIARSGSGTRDLFAGLGSNVTEMSEFQILQEAYRADPDATLDLIERILKAGRTQ